VIKNCNDELLKLLEPWCSVIYVDTYIEDYIEEENKNTLYNLHSRVRTTTMFTDGSHDIEIKFDGTKLTNQSFQYIQQLSDIISNDGELEVGEFDLDIFKIKINNLQTYEEGLIKCER